jgi:hypothetical protein
MAKMKSASMMRAVELTQKRMDADELSANNECARDQPKILMNRESSRREDEALIEARSTPHDNRIFEHSIFCLASILVMACVHA